MITLIELNHTLTRVGSDALALTKQSLPTHSRAVREGLKGVAWLLAEEIQGAT